MDDLWDFILLPLDLFLGWRFWAAFLPTIAVALLLHVVVGWNPATTAIVVVMAVISVVAGALWEHAHR